MDTEFCLGCDKPSSQGAYCSQVCRLKDTSSQLHGAPLSNTTSVPTYTAKKPTNRYSLPPAFDFSAYSSNLAMDSWSSSSTSASGTDSETSSKRSSMSSLSPLSTKPTSTATPINLWKVEAPLSPEAQDQLQSYDGYFSRQPKRPAFSRRFTFL